MAFAAYLLGGSLLALTFWRGWVGRPFAVPHVIYVEKPLPHLWAGLAALFFGYVAHRGYRNDAAAWRRLAGRGLMLALSVGLSAVLGEIGVRAMLWRAKQRNSLARLAEARAGGKPIRVRSSNPLAKIVQLSANQTLGYELQPRLNLDFGHHSLRTNGDGLRNDRDFAPGRLAGGLRVVGIGDSGMFGWGCDQGQTYLDTLERELQIRLAGVPCEVLNMAVPGYNTRLEVELLKEKGLKYQPDIVVVGWCYNDYDQPFFKLDFGQFKRRDVSFLHALLFDRVRLAELMGGNTIDAIRPPSPPKVSPETPPAKPADPITDEVSAALRDLVRLREAHGFRVLLFGPMDPHVTAICRELAIPYFNTYEKVDASRYPAEWNVHFMHPRPDGHRVLGEHLAAELDRLGWLKPRN